MIEVLVELVLSEGQKEESPQPLSLGYRWLRLVFILSSHYMCLCVQISSSQYFSHTGLEPIL
jgi:hypothetical protein